MTIKISPTFLYCLRVQLSGILLVIQTLSCGDALKDREVSRRVETGPLETSVNQGDGGVKKSPENGFDDFGETGSAADSDSLPSTQGEPPNSLEEEGDSEVAEEIEKDEAEPEVDLPASKLGWDGTNHFDSGDFRFIFLD